MKYNWFCGLLVMIVIFNGCKPDSDSVVTPVGGIDDLTTANAFLVETYRLMTTRSLFSDAYVIVPMLFSDEAEYIGAQNGNWKEASDFDLTPDNALVNTMFTDFYSISASLNVLFNEIDTSDDVTLTEDVKAGLIAEGRAIRGTMYWYIYNFWGGAPILTDSDGEQVDSLVGGVSLAEMFDFIEDDLLFAEDNIAKNSLNTGNQRLNEWNVKSLLARHYLYAGDYTSAKSYAEDVINNSGAQLESIINNIYDVNSSEHLWLLTESEEDVSIAIYTLQNFANGQHVVVPRDASFFEAGDLRKNVALSGPGTTILKYDDIFNNTDAIYLIRLAELYLIAAEANAALGSFNDANDHINAIRSRAGLADVSLNAANFEDLILQERRAELCYEGPHRWFDLKRTNNDVSTLQSYGYEITDNLWPFTTFFLDAFDLLEQNDGY